MSNHDVKAYLHSKTMTAPIELRTAHFEADQEAIRSIRFKVFVEEQQVPIDLEMDERDLHCIHLLAFAKGIPIATCRFDTAQNGKIGRVAVIKEWRRNGIGQAMMDKIHDLAKSKDLSSVWCNAQSSAIPFYRALGYQADGPSFHEAGIEHRRMEFTLLS